MRRKYLRITFVRTYKKFEYSKYIRVNIRRFYFEYIYEYNEYIQQNLVIITLHYILDFFLDFLELLGILENRVVKHIIPSTWGMSVWDGGLWCLGWWSVVFGMVVCSVWDGGLCMVVLGWWSVVGPGITAEGDHRGKC